MPEIIVTTGNQQPFGRYDNAVACVGNGETA